MGCNEGARIAKVGKAIRFDIEPVISSIPTTSVVGKVLTNAIQVDCSTSNVPGESMIRQFKLMEEIDSGALAKSALKLVFFNTAFSTPLVQGGTLSLALLVDKSNFIGAVDIPASDWIDIDSTHAWLKHDINIDFQTANTRTIWYHIVGNASATYVATAKFYPKLTVEIF